MKKFFKVLLLAAVALMPLMGMAQDYNSPEAKYERTRQIKEYEDSVQAAKQQAQYAHEMAMHSMRSGYRQQRFDAFWNSGVLPCCILGAGAILVLVLCLRHSRRKAEDHKELINKLIDNNLLNSTEPISKEAIEALMRPRKSDKERYIFDATLLGIGIAGSILYETEGLKDFFGLVAFILAGIGLLRIVTRATFSYFENKNARKKAAEAVRESKVKPIEEAEVIEEK